MMSRFLILLFFVMLQPTTSWSVDNRSGAWLGTFGKKPMTETTSFWSEVQLRYNSDIGSMAQTLFRGGFLYKLTENHELGLLLGYIQTNLQKEYRPTLQHLYQTKTFTESTLQLRTRIEFRDLEDNSENSLRYRLMIRSQSPLTSKLSLVIWDEPFLNLTTEDWTGSRFFERNRFFLGLRFPYESLNIETGYMNQFVPRSNLDTSEHLLIVYINY